MAKYIIRTKGKSGGRYDYFGGGRDAVGRRDATKYATPGEAEEALPIAANMLGVEQTELEARSLDSSGEHEPTQPSYERWRSGGRKTTGDEHKEDDALDTYIRRAQAFITSGQMDDDEIDYKVKIGQQLGEARMAVLDRSANWREPVKSGIASNLIHPVTIAKFRDWLDNSPDEANDALRAIYAEGDSSATERVGGFTERLLPSGITGVGVRTTVASVLLMGLDAQQHPPFRVGKFTEAYERTGYKPVPDGADEEGLYGHALGFLDKLLARTRELGFERPANRLEAQSVVWMMSGQSDPEEDEDTEFDTPTHVPDSDALADELLLDPGFLHNISRLLDEKRQVIFQGPPGTGKTFVARKLARALAGPDERVRLVQFHPSYAYEDFVQGFRPTLKDGAAGFELRDGPLVQMARQAQADLDKGLSTKHFLVIDEINRGNIAKVFGELYFLLEYRDQGMRLQYSDTDFSLPSNLYIIGTMNTADRSIALVDLALRRRFSFVEFHPDTEPVKGLLGRWLDTKAPDLRWVADVVDRANEKLENREAAIGPSYFMKDSLGEERVDRIWEHDVIPYVEEQLYGQHEHLKEFEVKALRSDIDGATSGSASGAGAAGEQEHEAGLSDAD